MKKLPIIGITSTRALQEGTFLTGMPKTILNSEYSDVITRVNGLPVIIPPVCREEEIGQFAELCDGLLVTGGKDIAPILYGEMSTGHCGAFDVETDKCHLELIRAFVRAEKPILGICRGLQLINVVFGGTLYQDLENEVPGSGGHSFGMFRHDPVHKVSLKAKSRLSLIMGTEMLEVNSIHHQAIKTLGGNVTACASSPDGIIEAVEIEGKPILAVQWHPEMMLTQNDGMLPLFREFIRKFS